MNYEEKLKEGFFEKFTEKHGTMKPSFRSFYWQRPEKIFNFISQSLSDYKKELGEKLSTWRGGYIKSDLGEDMFNELVSLLQKDKEVSK